MYQPKSEEEEKENKGAFFFEIVVFTFVRMTIDDGRMFPAK